MRATTTVIATRAITQTRLSADVAAVLPSLARKARGQLARNPRKYTGVLQTTVCPMCGGDKYRTSKQCRTCYTEVVTKGRERAHAKGQRSGGRLAGARALVVRHDFHGDEEGYVNTPRGVGAHTRGSGTVRQSRQWVRRELIDGRWVEVNEETSDVESE